MAGGIECCWFAQLLNKPWVLNWSFPEKYWGSSVRGERELTPFCSRRPPLAKEPRVGNWLWKPSAAMGYREGGSAPEWMGGGTLLRAGSRNGDGTCGLVERADCAGLVLFAVTGDWIGSLEPFVGVSWAAAWAAACASCSRRRYL